MHRARPGRCADARGTLRTPLGRASVPLEPTPMPMPACLAAARFRALARLADLVSRAYIQCMAEMAEDPRRSAERRRALELLAASPDGCTAVTGPGPCLFSAGFSAGPWRRCSTMAPLDSQPAATILQTESSRRSTTSDEKCHPPPTPRPAAH